MIMMTQDSQPGKLLSFGQVFRQCAQ